MKEKFKVVIETLVPAVFVYEVEASSKEEAEMLAAKNQVKPIGINYSINKRRLIYSFVTKIFSDIKIFTRRY